MSYTHNSRITDVINAIILLQVFNCTELCTSFRIAKSTHLALSVMGKEAAAFGLQINWPKPRLSCFVT